MSLGSAETAGRRTLQPLRARECKWTMDGRSFSPETPTSRRVRSKTACETLQPSSTSLESCRSLLAIAAARSASCTRAPDDGRQLARGRGDPHLSLLRNEGEARDAVGDFSSSMSFGRQLVHNRPALMTAHLDDGRTESFKVIKARDLTPSVRPTRPFETWNPRHRGDARDCRALLLGMRST